ncbi:hypothetical protein BN946_scf184298.g36 [Trametes cinnabarina]|uniref:ThuA-like domain-containing protein n=1 Tax=Pycnoporus cinnabarinus TaxID=5643 RepID=A0A060SXN4_PYCCI|nr:hypothetical protein BN946_scf184298.g36 [Trametes cinnabarina]
MAYVSAQPSIARVLIYSATRDFRHDSIPTAVDALVAHGPAANITFDHTEDETWFTDDRLRQYDGVVFLSNTGEVLNADEKAAFQRWLDLGGNFIGIHSASDCLRNTTFFQRELGAAFDYHPELQSAIVDVVGPSHPSTSMLPKDWSVRDEMYNFKSDPRSVGAVVILSANESSYTDPGPRKFDQGTPHPTAWFQEHGAGVDSNGTAGRSFYTSLGHLNETWQVRRYSLHGSRHGRDHLGATIEYYSSFQLGRQGWKWYGRGYFELFSFGHEQRNRVRVSDFHQASCYVFRANGARDQYLL